jgi:hypothetical protein
MVYRHIPANFKDWVKHKNTVNEEALQDASREVVVNFFLPG